MNTKNLPVLACACILCAGAITVSLMSPEPVPKYIFIIWVIMAGMWATIALTKVKR